MKEVGMVPARPSVMGGWYMNNIPYFPPVLVVITVICTGNLACLASSHTAPIFPHNVLQHPGIHILQKQ